MSGYLALAGDQVVGWCNASPRAQVTCVPLIELAPARIGSIVCFLIAPAFRGRGIAASLLNAACDGFAAQGFALAEGYPSKSGKSAQGANFPGPLSMYERAGFQIVRELGDSLVVQRPLYG